MLERYFARPDVLDRVRGSWLGEPIERYVEGLHALGYAARTVSRRVPLLMAFGAFAWERGARSWEDLPAQVEPFTLERVRDVSAAARRDRNWVRATAQGLVEMAVPGWRRAGARAPWPWPLSDLAPGFFGYLQQERGLRERSLRCYAHWLRHFERYLERVECDDLAGLSPPLVSGFVTELAAAGFSASSMTGATVALRVFLRYAHAAGLVGRDLSLLVESPRRYRLAAPPRSISWDEVRRMLEVVERRTVVGRRDYAILLLLITYGLRSREVAALTLDDLDWERDRLLVRDRKRDHTTAYPLAPVVGDGIIAYLENGRPASEDRRLFFRHLAPVAPITPGAVSVRTSRYLHQAGIRVHRPGSHTLRHACAQRLLDAGFPLKTIGDYVGHASGESTQVYTKVQIEHLREVALGEIETLP